MSVCMNIKMIENDSGVKAGNITYYFHSKEELLKVLVEELMDYHATTIEETHEKDSDVLFSYALEVAMQIALCKNDSNAWDLYHSASVNMRLPQLRLKRLYYLRDLKQLDVSLLLCANH